MFPVKHYNPINHIIADKIKNGVNITVQTIANSNIHPKATSNILIIFFMPITPFLKLTRFLFSPKQRYPLHGYLNLR